MLILDTSTSDVWIQALTVLDHLLVPLGGVLAYWLYKKLGAIHTLVNGNLTAAQKKVSELRTKLTELGHDPDA